MFMEMKKIYALPMTHIIPLHTAGTFRGYASTSTIDKIKDCILPGAFSQTLQHWKNEKKGFPNIYEEHHPDHFIGTCKSLYEDEKGLYIEGKLFIDDIPKAKEVYDALINGKKRGLSIGFYARDFVFHAGIRQIKTLDLVEISIVTHPCNAQAQIHEFKRDHDPTKSTDHMDMKRLRDLIALLKTEL